MGRKAGLVLLLALSAWAATAPPGSTDVITLGTLSSATTTPGINLPFKAHKHTLQVTITGSPASCNIQLEGTLDDINSTPNWTNLSGSQTCTSTTLFSVVERPVNAVRANLTALTGGSSPTVLVKYVGVQ